MKQLDQYIARHVFMATMVVIAVIVGLDAIFSMVEEIRRLSADYQFAEALQFTAMRLPRRAYEYMPMACLIGCLSGLGTLAASSELTVMRAAGISVQRIIIAVLKPMAILMVVSLLLAEFVVPNLERIAQTQKTIALGKSVTFDNRDQGFWHREGNTFMRFSAIEPNGVLHGITMYEFNTEDELMRVRRIDRALYQQEQWQLQNIQDLLISPSQTQMQSIAYEDWKTQLTPDGLSVVMVAPADMAISTLFTYTRYLQQQNINADQYLLSFWRKTLQPLGTFALVLLGISFIFGPLRAVTPGYRIFSGIMVGLLYKYTEDILAPVSIVAGFAPIWASVIPILLSAGLGLWLLKKAG